jgi:hypothetical protein
MLLGYLVLVENLDRVPIGLVWMLLRYVVMIENLG